MRQKSTEYFQTWACLVGMAFLLISASADLGFAAQSQELTRMLANARVRREMSIQSENVRFLSTTKDGIAVVVQTADGAEARVLRADGSPRFTFAPLRGAPESVRGVEVNEDGSIILVAALASSESMIYHVFDSSGTHLFDFPADGYLIPSPSGKLFCVQQSDFFHGPVTVLNSSREEVFAFNNPNAEWKAVFLDDDRLFVIDADTLRLFDIGSSQEIYGVPLPFGGVGLAPYVRFSREDSVLAVYNSKELVVISTFGEVLWRQKFEESLSTVAIEPAGGRLAVLLVNKAAGNGHFSILDLRDGTTLSKSEPMVRLMSTVRRAFEYCWFADGSITLHGPLGGDLSWYHDPAQNWTLMIEAPRGQSDLRYATVPGILRFIPSGIQQRNYIRVTSGTPTAIVSLD